MGDYGSRSKTAKLFWGGLNKTDPLYQEFLNSLCREYNNGYSVVQLARVLDYTCVRKVYELLLAGGAIQALRRTRGRKYAMPSELESVLVKCKFTYLQWCNSHGLDPEIAGSSLLKPLDRWDPESLSAHNSFQNDWRRLYGRVFDPMNTPSHKFSRDKRPGLINRDTVIIKYDDKELCFYAFNENKPEFRCYGKTRDMAFAALKRRYVLRASIDKLTLLAPHPGPAFLPAWEV